MPGYTYVARGYGRGQDRTRIMLGRKRPQVRLATILQD
jgi:hypothetical protein